MFNGLDRMKKRMEYDGGYTADDRNEKGKWLSFNSALNNTYHGHNITLKGQKCRCLINPDKLKENYDQKEISIDFKYGMQEGDVFYWDKTGTYWLVYLQDFDEKAYFRASIRRCDYELEVNGNPYRIYLRGPVETALIWRQKHQIETNDLNYSILFYITKNEETLEFFKRFQIVKFDGHNWRVAATDKYSQPGIIEVYLEEYFDNEFEDAEAIAIEPSEVQMNKPHIEGPRIVRPFDTNLSYSIVGLSTGEFTVNSNKVEFIEKDNKSCILQINSGKSGGFVLSYSTDNLIVDAEIVIKSF